MEVEMTTKLKKQILILDCCEVRFSRVISSWISEADINQKINVELFTDQSWNVTVHLVLSSSSCDGNPYSFDVIFLKSSDEELFEKLCNSLNKEGGWLENEKACLNVPKK